MVFKLWLKVPDPNVLLPSWIDAIGSFGMGKVISASLTASS